MPSPMALGATKTITNCNGYDQCHHPEVPKALTRQAPHSQQGMPWQSALKPQGGLANKHNKGIVRVL
jgi:hypothetical protein